MALGPNSTQPVDTNKQRSLEIIERKIDEIIRTTEGDTVTISLNRLPFWWYCYEDDIINIYKNSGWKYIYVNMNKNNLILTQNKLLVPDYFKTLK